MSHSCLWVSGKTAFLLNAMKTVAVCPQCFVILGGVVFDVFSSSAWQDQSVLNAIFVFAGQWLEAVPRQLWKPNEHVQCEGNSQKHQQAYQLKVNRDVYIDSIITLNSNRDTTADMGLSFQSRVINQSISSTKLLDNIASNQKMCFNIQFLDQWDFTGRGYLADPEKPQVSFEICLTSRENSGGN